MKTFNKTLLASMAVMSSITACAANASTTIIDLDGYLIPVVTDAQEQPFVPLDPSLYPSKQVIQLYPEFANPDSANARTTGDVARMQAAQLLGNGYDDITGEVLANDCWNTSTKLDIIDTEALVNELPVKEIEIIKDYDVLTSFLKDDRKAAGKLALKPDVFINVTNADKKVVENTKRIHEYGVVAFKMRHKHKRYAAKPLNELTMNSRNILELETQSQPAGRQEFRSMCGDQYVSSVTSGRELMGTVRIHTHVDNSDGQQDITNKFNAGIKTLFTLTDFTQIKDNDFVQKHDDLEFQLVYSRIGGRPLSELKDMKITIKDEATGQDKEVPALSGDIDTVHELAALIVSFNEKYEDDKTLGLVASQQQNYPITDKLLAQNKTHYQVFLDYNPTARKLASWHLLDGMVEQRCAIYSPDKGAGSEDLNKVGLDSDYYISAAPKKIFDGVQVTQHNLCLKIRDTITDFKNRCTKHTIWADPNMSQDEQCQYPKAQECFVTSGYRPVQCMQRAQLLDTWEITKGGYTVSADDSSQPFEVGIGSGLVKKSKTETGKYCFRANDYLIDIRKSWTSLPEAQLAPTGGVTVNVLEAHNLSSVHSIVSHLEDAPACMSHTATVTRPGWDQSAARYKAEVILHGYKPVPNLGYPL